MKKYFLGLYEKAMPKNLSWEEKFIVAKKTGFDFIEISIDETDEKLDRLNMTIEEINIIKNTMEKTGIYIKTMCLSGHRKYSLGSHKEETRKKALNIMEKAIKLADALGINIIQLAGYDVYYEESDEITKQFFLENLKKSVEIAAKFGIILAFETMETEFLNTVEKSIYYVKEISSPYLNCYPDIGNITNAAFKYKTNVLEDLKKGKGHIVAMHLKEAKPDIFREVPFGEGYVDFEKAIEYACNLGVRKFVAEFWYTDNPKWEDDLLFAYKKMSKILDKNC